MLFCEVSTETDPIHMFLLNFTEQLSIHYILFQNQELEQHRNSSLHTLSGLTLILALENGHISSVSVLKCTDIDVVQ